MTASTAIACNLEIDHSSSKSLFGFGCTETPAVKTLGKAVSPITIDDVEAVVDLWIVPDTAQSFPILIGRTWTEQSHVCVLKIDNNLVISNRNCAPFVNLEVNKSNVKLLVTKEVELSANQEQLVKVVSDQPCDGVFLVKSGLSDHILNIVDSTASIPVRLPITRIVKEGECVARATPVESVQHDKVPPCANDLSSLITSEQITVGQTVTPEEKSELLDLVNEFRCCFALNMSELGCCKLERMDIIEKPGSQPVACKPYRVSPRDRDVMKNIISQWREEGIITDTVSPYASPVLLVDKRDGEKRLVVDFRRLNSQTVAENFPLPVIDDLLQELVGGKLFIVLDLAHGYLQMELTESAKEKTAFITPDETGQFERLIFGLRNGPARFQRMMNKLLKDFKGKSICYLDDILIWAVSWKELLSRLHEVLQAIKEAGLTLRLKKCVFGAKSVQYLGYKICDGKIFPGDAKTAAIANFPVPTNLHEVRRFIGLTSYFRRFVARYAELADPLCGMLKKGRHVDGDLRPITDIAQNNDYQKPVEKLKEATEQILINQERYKTNFDHKRRFAPKFEIGDIVFMKYTPQSTGSSLKCEKKFRGPLVITRVLPSDTYGVADLLQKNNVIYATTAHVSQLKSWKKPGLDEKDDDEDDSE